MCEVKLPRPSLNVFQVVRRSSRSRHFIFCWLQTPAEKKRLFQKEILCFLASWPRLLVSLSHRTNLTDANTVVPPRFNCASILQLFAYVTKLLFALRALNFQLLVSVSAFSGSNNFVPFLILWHNYGFIALLGHAGDISLPPSSSLFFWSFLVGLSLIIHRERMGNFSAICSCWIPVIVLQGVAQKEILGRRLCSPECNLAVSLWQATHH